MDQQLEYRFANPSVCTSMSTQEANMLGRAIALPARSRYFDESTTLDPWMCPAPSPYLGDPCSSPDLPLHLGQTGGSTASRIVCHCYCALILALLVLRG